MVLNHSTKTDFIELHVVSQGLFWSPTIIFNVKKMQFLAGFFQCHKGPNSLLDILSIYLFKICLANILLIGMELIQDSANEL